MRISKRRALCLLGLLLPSLAWADSVVFPSCSKGGFTGTIGIDYSSPARGSARVLSVSYKINKGKNSGGNRANVYYTDHGSLPAKKFGTSGGVQDDKLHFLGGGSGGSYSTAKSSGISIRFVFDKSRASDPSCSIYYRIP